MEENEAETAPESRRSGLRPRTEKNYQEHAAGAISEDEQTETKPEKGKDGQKLADILHDYTTE